MTVPYVLNRVAGENIPLSAAKAEAYQKHYHAPGLFLSWEDQFGVDIQNGTLPISTIRGIGSVEEGKDVLEQAKADWDAAPRFSSLLVCSPGT